MAKIASAKQTGQGGTSYEDKTIAFFLACLLTETSPFGPTYGKIIKISFQVRADGWHFDDCLLKLENNVGQHNVAVSIKSARHFTVSGCTQEVNRMLWEQCLGIENKVFEPANDYLCLVEAPLAVTVSESLNTILQQAKVQDAEEMFDRNQIEGYNSVDKRKMFNSFSCPPDLAASHNVNPKDIGKVLKQFIHIEFDFEKVVSSSESRTIELCRAALTNKEQATSDALFKRLCQVARDMAASSGTINLTKLANILVGQFGLAAFPSFLQDWKRNEDYVKGKISTIRDDIGGKVKLSRVAIKLRIEECFAKSNGCMLTGISGGGKTSVAKIFAEQKLSENSQVIWIDGADEQNDLLHVKLGLEHSIAELIKSSGEQSGYLIIDGIEKMYQASIQTWITVILSNVLAEGSGWKVLITLPIDTLDTAQKMFHSHNLQSSLFTKCQLQQLDHEDILLLIKEFPQVGRFFLKDSMRLILSNLKLLDSILVDAVKLNDIADREFGETQLIDFIWTNQIEQASNGPQKSAFLKLLSEKQADSLAINISSSEFGISDLAPAANLVADNFLSQRDEHFFFMHDLYGDWSRYKLLLSKIGDIKGFLSTKHLASPLWSRGIRLWGISLLEKNVDCSEWLKRFSVFSSGSTHDKNVQDLLLESFIFSSNSYELLERSKEMLFADDGDLFKRLMKLFAVRATSSNPEILILASSLNISEAAALDIDRIPVINYWIDFLRFMHENVEAITNIDLIMVSSIASTWIRNTPQGFLLRKEACDMVCLVAEKIFHKETNMGYIPSKISAPVYESMLSAYIENPDRIKFLALLIAKRMRVEKKSVAGDDPGDLNIAPEAGWDDNMSAGILASVRREAEQWHDGPYERVEEAFQNACLSNSALHPLMQLQPDLATELMLAAIIDEPKDIYNHFGRMDDDYSIYSPIGWYPPFFLRGPFLSFFRLHPKQAIGFMNKLVDFVTERYIDNQQTGKTEEFELVTLLEGNEKIYKGDMAVFHWHKDSGNPPHLIVSLLMAFEQFLYETIEQKRDIDRYTQIAVGETNSLAVIGVVLVVSKMHWQLFSKELLHLLFHPILLLWDRHSQHSESLFGFADLPRAWQDQAKKWKALRHRYFPLKDALLNHFLSDSDFQEKFKIVIASWEAELVGADPQTIYAVYLKQVIAQFKMENWLSTDHGLTYKEPNELTEQLDDGRKESLSLLDYGGYAFRSRQIIASGQPITLEASEVCWNELQQFVTKLDDTPAMDENGLGAWSSPLTNILAAMALLLSNRKVWETSHPEYLKYIKDFCVAIIQDQKLSTLNYNTYAGMDDWTTFMAEIAPVIWKDDLTDKDSRFLIAGCCILFGQAVTERLFTATAATFRWSDPAFIQIQNLLVIFSSELDGLRSSRGSSQTLPNVRATLIDRFIDGDVSTLPLEWANVRQPEKWKAKESSQWRRQDGADMMRAPGLSTEVLIPMLKHMPSIDTTAGSCEQQHIFFLLAQSFQQVIYGFGNIKQDSVAIDSYPDNFSLMTLQKGASELVAVPEPMRGDFWKTLFSFGYIANRHIEIFCKSFFLRNLVLPDRYETMASIVKDMVEFTNTQPTWAIKHVSRHTDFRLAVVGMQPDFVSIWSDDYSGFMAVANDVYTAWFSRKKINPFAVLSLLDFLTTKSGQFLIPEGLNIINAFFKLGVSIANSGKVANMVFVGHPEHDSKLALLLSHLWNNKQQILVSSPGIFNNYKDLVQYLVSINNMAGIHLQDKLMLG